MDTRWHVPSVQETGQAVNTVVTADDHAGKVLIGTAGRSLTHLSPQDARDLATALGEAADRVDPGQFGDPARDLLDALRVFIDEVRDR